MTYKVLNPPVIMYRGSLVEKLCECITGYDCERMPGNGGSTRLLYTWFEHGEGDKRCPYCEEWYFYRRDQIKQGGDDDAETEHILTQPASEAAGDADTR